MLMLFHERKEMICKLMAMDEDMHKIAVMLQEKKSPARNRNSEIEG
jgi:hypothetical protein